MKNHSRAVKAEMEERTRNALGAMGAEGADLTVGYIKGTKYGKPIVRSGQLRDSIDFATNPPERAYGTEPSVTIGSHAAHAPLVHEGTARMKARMFLQDALLENRDKLREAAERALKRKL